MGQISICRQFFPPVIERGDSPPRKQSIIKSQKCCLIPLEESLLSLKTEKRNSNPKVEVEG
jgi:hypothetical protein